MDPKFRITHKFIFCLFFVALFGIATVSASDSLPVLPQEFYGTVTVGGGIPAPINSVVKAYVNGVDSGSITTDVAGYYGEFGGTRLLVSPKPEDLSVSNVVTFYVNNVKTDQQAIFVAGGPTVNLALTVGSGGTQTPTPVPTSTPAPTLTTTPVPTDQPMTEPTGVPSLPQNFYGMVTTADNQLAPFGTLYRHPDRVYSAIPRETRFL